MTTIKIRAVPADPAFAPVPQDTIFIGAYPVAEDGSAFTTHGPFASVYAPRQKFEPYPLNPETGLPDPYPEAWPVLEFDTSYNSAIALLPSDLVNAVSSHYVAGTPSA